MKIMNFPRTPTKFRNWINNLWVTNCEERFIVGEPRLDPKTYFKKYKWWLRREYRFQLTNPIRNGFLL